MKNYKEYMNRIELDEKQQEKLLKTLAEAQEKQRAASLCAQSSSQEQKESVPRPLLTRLKYVRAAAPIAAVLVILVGLVSLRNFGSKSGSEAQYADEVTSRTKSASYFGGETAEAAGPGGSGETKEADQGTKATKAGEYYGDGSLTEAEATIRPTYAPTATTGGTASNGQAAATENAAYNGTAELIVPQYIVVSPGGSHDYTQDEKKWILEQIELGTLILSGSVQTIDDSTTYLLSIMPIDIIITEETDLTAVPAPESVWYLIVFDGVIYRLHKENADAAQLQTWQELIQKYGEP